MKKILIAPLDWGLGHATRCIPIIRELLTRECTVLVAGSGDSLLLLKNEFRYLTFFTLPSYNPVYATSKKMTWKILTQVPKFVKAIKAEHRQIESLVEEYNIDVIISDNRYGCWSRKTRSIFVTHQLNILMPKGLRWLQPFIHFLNKKFIEKFSACWVPDFPEKSLSLSGKLSERNEKRVNIIKHIGPLSRFSGTNNQEHQYDLVCVFSGPEPQRSIFEKKVKEQLRDSGLRYFVIRGVLSHEPGSSENEAAFLNSGALEVVMSRALMVIARSGYSTIMDLAVLGKRGILVPTPGQTEQEYLADRWKEKGAFYSAPQHKFNLQAALNESKAYPGFTIDRSRATQLLNKALAELLGEPVTIEG